MRSWGDVVGGLLERLNAWAAQVEERNRLEEQAWAEQKAAEAAAAPDVLDRLGVSLDHRGRVSRGSAPPEREDPGTGVDR